LKYQDNQAVVVDLEEEEEGVEEIEEGVVEDEVEDEEVSRPHLLTSFAQE
jgi:hypothetical protein